MENKLFRQKNLDRIQSPEQLQDYMRVTNPSVWMVLIAVIVLLAGLIVFAIVGRIETTVPAEFTVRNGIAVDTVRSDREPEVSEGMTLRLGGTETTIDSVLWNADQTAALSAQISLPDGTYSGTVVLETISPIRFLWKE